MTEPKTKSRRPHYVHARLTDDEYAKFRVFVESDPNFENSESITLRRLIRDVMQHADRITDRGRNEP